MKVYTNEQQVAYAFERAFDDIGDETLESILNAFNTFPIHNPGKVIQYLHETALDQIDYRNQSFADAYAEQGA
jgi:hypothetical protein